MGRQNPRREYQKLFRDGEQWPSYMRGFGGMHRGIVDRYMDPWDAYYSLNFFTREDIFGTKMGALSTRHGYAPAHTYGLRGFAGDLATNYEVRALHKWYPQNTADITGEMVRILHDNFQVNDGAGWVQKNTAEPFNNTTAYPMMIEAGWPVKHLFIAMPGNDANPGGLYCYDKDGNFWKQKINTYEGNEVKSLRWITVAGDGRLYACGDWIDDDMPLIVVYSGPAKVGSHTDPTDTTYWTYPNGGTIIIYAQGPRNLSGPTRITGIAWLNGYVVVFTETGRYIIANPGTASQYTKYYPGYGCWNGNLVTENPYDGKIYWWDAQGGYCWAGAGSPDRLSNPMWGVLENLRAVDGSGNYCAHKFFSFIYMGQWWTQMRTQGLTGIGTSKFPGVRGHDLNTNFVYDFHRRQWYLANIPMTAVTVAQAGLDIGALYFSSPVDTNLGGDPQFKTHRYGFNEATGQAVYGDDGANILANWNTGKVQGKDFFRRKQYKDLFMNVEVGDGPGAIGAAIYVRYDGGARVEVSWATNPDSAVVHKRSLGNNFGNFAEFEFYVLSQRQTTIYGAQYSYEELMTDG